MFRSRRPKPDNVGFIDVGARGGSDPRLEPFYDRLDRVLFEPDPDEAARLAEASQNGRLFKIVPAALAHVDGDLTLHVTVNEFCTSILKPNYDFLEQYRIKPHFESRQAVPMKCMRYDTLYAQGDVPLPEIVKIDVQGFEYQVLQGFGRHLDTCLAIKLETDFYPLYKDQRIIGDIVGLLDIYGLRLRRLSNDRTKDMRGDGHFDGDLVEVEAYFSKGRAWYEAQSQSTKTRFDLACDVLDIDRYT